MLTCGRGRGRGRGIVKEIEVPLRRPGENPSSKNNQSMLNDIIEGINNVAINETKLSDEIIEKVYLVNVTKDEKTLKSLFENLYKHALEDKIFGIKFARLFINVISAYMKDDDDKTMRDVILGNLQNDYLRREEIRKENETLFRNVISLLGEINYSRYLKYGFPYRVIAEAGLDYWNMLLETATEEDIELLVTQVIINGQSTSKICPTKFNEFMLNVRKTLLNNNLSALIKGMLLLIIDLANHQFDSLPTNINDYYMSLVGTTVVIYLQRHKQSVNNDETTKKKKQQKMPSSNNWKPRKNEAVDDDKNDFSTENTVPRAIRGPGASNRGRNIKNQSKRFTNSPPSQHNTKNKGWDHDDRFENDYN